MLRCNVCGASLGYNHDLKVCPWCGSPLAGTVTPPLNKEQQEHLKSELTHLSYALQDIDMLLRSGQSRFNIAQLYQRYSARTRYIQYQLNLAAQAEAQPQPSPAPAPNTQKQESIPPLSQVQENVHPEVKPEPEKAAPGSHEQFNFEPLKEQEIKPPVPPPAIQNAPFQYTSRPNYRQQDVPHPAPVPQQTQPPAPVPQMQQPAAFAAQQVPLRPEMPRVERRAFDWRAFLADQAIALMSYMGGFLLIIATLMFVIYGWDFLSNWAKFAVVFAVHAVFGIVGWFMRRSPKLRMVGRIYLGVFSLMVPLVGFAAYRFLLQPVHIPPAGMVTIAAVYASIIYLTLAMRLRFSTYAYIGLATTALATLAGMEWFGLSTNWLPAGLAALAGVFLWLNITFSGRWPVICRYPCLYSTYSTIGIAWLWSAILAFIAANGYPGYNAPQIYQAFLVTTCLILIWSYSWQLLYRNLEIVSIPTFFTVQLVMAVLLVMQAPLAAYGVALAGIGVALCSLAIFIRRRIDAENLISYIFLMSSVAAIAAGPFLTLMQSGTQNLPLLLTLISGLGVIIAISLEADMPWLLLASVLYLDGAINTLGPFILPPSQLQQSSAPIYFAVTAALSLVGLAIRLRFGGRKWALPVYSIAIADAFFTLFLSLNESPLFQSAVLLSFALWAYALITLENAPWALILSAVFAAPAAFVADYSSPFKLSGLPITLLVAAALYIGLGFACSRLKRFHLGWPAYLIAAYLGFAAGIREPNQSYAAVIMLAFMTVSFLLSFIEKQQYGYAVTLIFAGGVIAYTPDSSKLFWLALLTLVIAGLAGRRITLQHTWSLYISALGFAVASSGWAVVQPSVLPLSDLLLVFTVLGFTAALLEDQVVWLGFPVISGLFAIFLIQNDAKLLVIAFICSAIGLIFRRYQGRYWGYAWYGLAFTSAVAAFAYDQSVQLFSWLDLLVLVAFILSLLEDSPYAMLVPMLLAFGEMLTSFDTLRLFILAVLPGVLAFAVTRKRGYSWSLALYSTAFLLICDAIGQGYLAPTRFVSNPTALSLLAPENMALFAVVVTYVLALYERQYYFFPFTLFFAVAEILLTTGYYRLAALALIFTLLAAAMRYKPGLRWSWPLYAIALGHALAAMPYGLAPAPLVHGMDSTLLTSTNSALVFAALVCAVALWEDQIYFLAVPPVFILIATALSVSSERFFFVAVITTVIAFGLSKWRGIRWAYVLYGLGTYVAFVAGAYGYNSPPPFNTEYMFQVFAVLAYLVAILEDQPLWIIAPESFAVLGLLTIHDHTYLFIAAIILAGLGYCLSQYKGRVWGWSVYPQALLAAVLALYYGASAPLPLTDPNMLLVFAAVAYLIAAMEQQPYWLVVPFIFGVTYAFMATDATSITVLTIIITSASMVVGRKMGWKWSWSSYAIALALSISASLRGLGQGGEFELVILAAFAIVSYIAALIEMNYSFIFISITFSIFAASNVSSAFNLPMWSILVSYIVLSWLICMLGTGWYFAPWFTNEQRESGYRLHYIVALMGAGIIPLYTAVFPDAWQNGGVFTASNPYTQVGALALFCFAAMLAYVSDRIATQRTSRALQYLAGFLVSLSFSWEAAYFGYDNIQFFILAPSTYLIILGALLPRDRVLNADIAIARLITGLGSVLLVLPTLGQTFTDSAWLYTVALLTESLILTILGIGFKARVLVLIGSSFVGVAAIRALFITLPLIPIWATFGAASILLLTCAGILSWKRDVISVMRGQLNETWNEME